MHVTISRNDERLLEAEIEREDGTKRLVHEEDSEVAFIGSVMREANWLSGGEPGEPGEITVTMHSSPNANPRT